MSVVTNMLYQSKIDFQFVQNYFGTITMQDGHKKTKICIDLILTLSEGLDLNILLKKIKKYFDGLLRPEKWIRNC